MGFQSLMKTGRPGGCYLPSRWTVARDVQLVFARTHNQIAKMLQVGWATVQQYKLLTHLPEIWRKNKLYYWCMDIAHPLGFCCILCPLGAQRQTTNNAIRSHWSPKGAQTYRVVSYMSTDVWLVTHWYRACNSVCDHAGGLWNIG